MRLSLGDGGGQHLCSYLGLLNWYLRPRDPGCPYGAGACCWVQWGRMVDGEQQLSRGVPIKQLNSFATLAALEAVPWASPSREDWPHLSAFCFGSDGPDGLFGFGGGPSCLC